ncbi:MAG: sigma 54-interacting transcriptional regulator [Clostridia bacterium]
MIKITAIAPYEEYANLFMDIFDQHNKTPYKPEYEQEDYELEIILSPSITGLVNKKFQSDVIVARSGFVYFLRKSEDFIPIVEVPIAGNDLIIALHECKDQFDSKEVAVIGSANMIFGAERLSDIVGMNVIPFLFPDSTKAEYTVKEVLKKGIYSIIGGVKSTEYAKNLGANAVLIKSGRESIWQAITEAKRTAYISRREQERAERYKTIMDYSYEGVIAIDNNNLISVFNTAAQKILHIKDQSLNGEVIHNILPKSEILNILNMDKKYLNEIIEYNNIQISANMIPIVLKGEHAGKVLTFQDITKIQEVEGKIRRKIHTHGHIAKYTFNDILGESEKIKEALETAQNFSTVDSNILIFGETGTGKELFAQSIHNYSFRSTGPFVAVNCATLPENLLESELFGYAEGAFTGASKGGKPGLFELAHKGTIFLDEISETSLKLQGQLLRVLQEKEIRRIGHDRIIPVDVRVITASNKDLNLLVHKELFREDLYYRLNILKINLPPLRERKQDILVLAKSFIAEYLLKLGKEDIELTKKIEETLMNYDWPGNIRQLRNICERLVVLNKFNIIKEDDIQKAFIDCSFSGSPLMNTPINDISTITTVNRTHNNPSSYVNEIKQLEKVRIKEALEKNLYNKAKTARVLGINRTTLWRRMKELGIEDLTLSSNQ